MCQVLTCVLPYLLSKEYNKKRRKSKYTMQVQKEGKNLLRNSKIRWLVKGLEKVQRRLKIKVSSLERCRND